MPWGRRGRPQPNEWKIRKAHVLAQHQGRCHQCLHPGAEQVDHIINVAAGGTHELGNLAPIHNNPCPVCQRRCHQEKTQREARAGRPSRRRPTEAHPGLR